MSKYCKQVAFIILVAVVFFFSPHGGGDISGAGLSSGTQKIICIDPGHQNTVNNELEPIGPGSSETKVKQRLGTRGVVTRIYEYEFNLVVSQKLRKKFEDNGYKVVMTRTNHNVDISNKERAIIANRANADVLLRIHADGSYDSSHRGISVLHPNIGNPYLSGDLTKKSKRLAEYLLDELIKETGASLSIRGENGLMPRSDIVGFNWSEVPVVLPELGFMTNPEDDRLLAQSSYQDKLVNGMFKGVERYFQSLIVPVESVKLNNSSKTVYLGESETLVATVSPHDATNKDVKWSSSDKSVATVDSKGRVTAVGLGEAVITVTTKDGAKKASCEIKVPYIAPESVMLNRAEATMFTGGVRHKTRLRAVISPEKTTNKEVTWETDNPDVAAVSHNGVITAMEEGTATITVTTKDGGLQASSFITVEDDGVFYGDVNNDGVIDIKDAIQILRYVVGLTSIPPEQLKAADANGNGDVNIFDAIVILRYIVGLY